jgi:hypothetical protein
MKIVINICYGGFGLSDAAYEFLIQKGVPFKKCEEGVTESEYTIYESEDEGREQWARLRGTKYWDNRQLKRSDPRLVELVETLGDKASGKYAELKVVEIPDGVEWEIEEYDGTEWVAEKHRTWS